VFLTVTSLPHYLVNRGSLRAADLLDQQVTIAEAGRRNRNFHVQCSRTPGLFVKQVKAMHAELQSTVWREALTLRLSRENAAFAAVAAHAPRLVDYDERRHTLTTELIPHGENLNDFHRRAGMYPVDVAERTGAALASLHAAGSRMLADPAAAAFPRALPWVFSILANIDTTIGAAPDGIKAFVRELERTPEIALALADLAFTWRPTVMMHGDVKWDNVIALGGDAAPGGDGVRDVRLVDWELCDAGEPLWDIAGALTAYLGFWLFTVPGDPSQPEPAVMLAHAPQPVESLHPAVRALWQTYCRDAAMPADGDSGATFLRLMRMVGVRFVQLGFELHAESPVLTQPGVFIARLARAFALDPLGTAHSMFGLTP
jgi:Ser/Thr protein kinase RdoA (MazF antagonist)